MDYLEFYKLRAEPFRNELNALFYFDYLCSHWDR